MIGGTTWQLFQDNKIVNTIFINQKKGSRKKLLEMLDCYNFAKGLTDEKEDCFLALKKDLFIIKTMTLPQPNLPRTQTLANGQLIPPLQQTQANGLGTTMDGQKETASQTKVHEGQMQYPAHFIPLQKEILLLMTFLFGSRSPLTK